ncbi:hypothetical protein [Spirosoma gilvum]
MRSKSAYTVPNPFILLNDLLDRPLQQIHLDIAPVKPYRFNTSQLPNGLYLIQVTPADQVPTILRLLIQR